MKPTKQQKAARAGLIPESDWTPDKLVSEGYRKSSGFEVAVNKALSGNQDWSESREAMERFVARRKIRIEALRTLARVEGTVSIHGGIATLETGETIDLNQFRKETR